MLPVLEEVQEFARNLDRSIAAARGLFGLKAPPLMALPRVVAWLERIAERPAVVRGMAVPE